MPNAFLPSSKNKLYLLCIAGCLQDIQQGPSLGLRLPELEICSIFILTEIFSGIQLLELYDT